eukprot:g930.t1
MFEACAQTRSRGAAGLLKAAKDLVRESDGRRFQATRLVLDWVQDLIPSWADSGETLTESVRSGLRTRLALLQGGPKRLVEMKISTASSEIAGRYALATEILERLGGGDPDFARQVRLVRCLHGCTHEVVLAFLEYVQSELGLGLTGSFSAHEMFSIMLGNGTAVEPGVFMDALEQFTSTTAGSTIRRDKLRRALDLNLASAPPSLLKLRDKLTPWVIKDLEQHPSSKVLEYNFMRHKEAQEALQRAIGGRDSDVSAARANEEEAGRVLGACMKQTMSGNLMHILEDLIGRAEEAADPNRKALLEGILVSYCERALSSNILPLLVDMKSKARADGNQNRKDLLDGILISYCDRASSSEILPLL